MSAYHFFVLVAGFAILAVVTAFGLIAIDNDPYDEPPYGQGTAETPCSECWRTPSRHCCMWDEPDLDCQSCGARFGDIDAYYLHGCCR